MELAWILFPDLNIDLFEYWRSRLAHSLSYTKLNLRLVGTRNRFVYRLQCMMINSRFSNTIPFINKIHIHAVLYCSLFEEIENLWKEKVISNCSFQLVELLIFVHIPFCHCYAIVFSLLIYGICIFTMQCTNTASTILCYIDHSTKTLNHRCFLNTFQFNIT